MCWIKKRSVNVIGVQCKNQDVKAFTDFKQTVYLLKDLVMMREYLVIMRSGSESWLSLSQSTKNKTRPWAVMEILHLICFYFSI